MKKIIIVILFVFCVFSLNALGEFYVKTFELSAEKTSDVLSEKDGDSSNLVLLINVGLADLKFENVESSTIIEAEYDKEKYQYKLFLDSKPGVMKISHPDFEDYEINFLDDYAGVNEHFVGKLVLEGKPINGQTSTLAIFEDAPIAIKQFPPIYPRILRINGLGGIVCLKVEVLIDGSVGVVEVERSAGPGGLDEAAVDAVKRWKYIPAKKDGKPVAVWITFPINFSIGRM